MIPTNELIQQRVRWHHHLHRFPETGFNEAPTSYYVDQVLAAQVDRLSRTGSTTHCSRTTIPQP